MCAGPLAQPRATSGYLLVPEFVPEALESPRPLARSDELVLPLVMPERFEEVAPLRFAGLSDEDPPTGEPPEELSWSGGVMPVVRSGGVIPARGSPFGDVRLADVVSRELVVELDLSLRLDVARSDEDMPLESAPAASLPPGVMLRRSGGFIPLRGSPDLSTEDVPLWVDLSADELRFVPSVVELLLPLDLDLPVVVWPLDVDLSDEDVPASVPPAEAGRSAEVPLVVTPLWLRSDCVDDVAPDARFCDCSVESPGDTPRGDSAGDMPCRFSTPDG
jgi:hypothetical protein